MTYQLKTDLPDPPIRILALPVDHRGFPVPWFVAWIDGKPDHRVVDAEKVYRAVRENRCFICGNPLGRYKASILGPMCAINRTISEPPSHRDCAEFSLRACPFLTIPQKRRRERDLPEDARDAAGNHLRRNPGVAALWIGTKVTPFKVPANEYGRAGILFRVHDPVEVLWFAEGRAATRDEVEASIESGLPALIEVARTEGKLAVDSLAIQLEAVKQYLPAVIGKCAS